MRPSTRKRTAASTRNDRGDDGDRGVENETGFRKLVGGLQRGAQREERRRRREQSDQHDLAQQPRPVGLRARVLHTPFSAADGVPIRET